VEKRRENPLPGESASRCLLWGILYNQGCSQAALQVSETPHCAAGKVERRLPAAGESLVPRSSSALRACLPRPSASIRPV